MGNFDPEKLAQAKVRKHEGWRSTIYNDTKGNPTVGTGYNLNDPVTATLVPPEVRQGKRPLSKEEDDVIFSQRFKMAEDDARRWLGPTYDNLDEERKSVVVNMSYNMGLPTLSGFKKMKDALLQGDYDAAAREMKDSKWYQQTKDRAKELIRIMEKTKGALDLSALNPFKVGVAHAGGGFDPNKLAQVKQTFDPNKVSTAKAGFDLAKLQSAKKTFLDIAGIVAAPIFPTAPFANKKVQQAAGAAAKAVFPLSWIDAAISGPAVKIQERAPGMEVAKALLDNVVQHGVDAVRGIAQVSGLQKEEQEVMDRAKNLGDVWGNYYKAITKHEAPEWYKIGAGLAQIVGLSPLSPEFKKVIRELGKGAAKGAVKTVEAVSNVPKEMQAAYAKVMQNRALAKDFISKYGKHNYNALKMLEKELLAETGASAKPEYVAKMYGAERPAGIVQQVQKPGGSIDLSKETISPEHAMIKAGVPAEKAVAAAQKMVQPAADLKSIPPIKETLFKTQLVKAAPQTGEGKPTKQFGFTDQGLYEKNTTIPLSDIPKRSIATPEYRDDRVVAVKGRKVTKPIVAVVEDINNPNSPIEIVDGWHRYRQAVANGDENIPIKLIYKPASAPQTGGEGGGITLYRGSNKEGGTWFTPDKEAAQEYANLNESGKVEVKQFEFNKVAEKEDILKTAQELGLKDANKQALYWLVSPENYHGAEAIIKSLEQKGFNAIHLPKGEDFTESGKAIESYKILSPRSTTPQTGGKTEQAVNKILGWDEKPPEPPKPPVAEAAPEPGEPQEFETEITSPLKPKEVMPVVKKAAGVIAPDGKLIKEADALTRSLKRQEQVAREIARKTKKETSQVFRMLEKMKQEPVESMGHKERLEIENIKLKVKSAKTLDELKSLYKRAQEIKAQGKAKYQEIKAAKDAEYQITKEVLTRKLKPRKKQAVREIGQEKKKSSLAVYKASSLGGPRLFDKLDGGADFKGPWSEFFYNRANRAVDAELAGKNTRIEKMSATMKELAITPRHLAGTKVIDGIKFTNDQIISLYTGLKNKEKLSALVLGNEIPLETIEKAVAQMSESEKKFGDAIIRDYEEHYDRYNNAFVEYTDGKHSMERVDGGYTPLRRIMSGRQPTDEDIATELLERKNLRKAYADRSSTKARTMKGEKQLPIRLGEYELWGEQIAKQEHFISHGSLIKEMQRMVNSPDVVKAISESIGIEHLEAVQNWVNRVANPSIYKAFSNIEKIGQTLRGNAAIAYLWMNFNTMLKQFPSFFLFLQDTGPVEMLSGLWQITAQHRKSVEMIHSLAPQMKNRSIERELEEFKRLNLSAHKRIIKKVGVQGMKGIMAIDHLATHAGWLAVFDQEVKNMSPQQAADLATQAVLRHQPAAHPKDIPDFYASNEFLNWFLQFSNQQNKIYNMLTWDIPSAAREGRYADALRAGVGVLLSQALIFVLMGGLNQKNKGKAAAEVGIGLIPVAGPVIVASSKGFGGSTVPALSGPATLGKGMANLFQGKTGKAVGNFVEAAMVAKGIPMAQPVRSITGAEELASGDADNFLRLFFGKNVIAAPDKSVSGGSRKSNRSGRRRR